MLRRRLIRGKPLLGFAEIFDGAWGDPRTDRPYVHVTPSRIGEVLLPFSCPHCAEVRSEAVDPRRRGRYADKERGFSFCPACLGRYVLHAVGMVLMGELPAGATSAPARVERGGKVEQGAREGGAFDLIGAV